jgi:hypothetical protein
LVMVFFSMLQFCKIAEVKPASSSSSSNCQKQNLHYTHLEGYLGSA